jgi:uncharacterized protein (DUF1697 family)
VNVGGQNLVPMKSLPPLFESIGCTHVATLLQSGNVVFSSTARTPRLAAAIETALADAFRWPVLAVVRSHGELASCVEANPYPQAGGKQLHVVFLGQALSADARTRLERAAEPPDELTVAGTELYLHCPDGVGRSKLALAAGKVKGDPRATARNWNTVTRLVELTT